MARPLTDPELTRVASLLAAQKPREYWEAGRILLAAIDSEPAKKKSTRRNRNAWMEKYQGQISKHLRHYITVRTLFVCRELVTWDKKDIKEIEDAGLSIRKAIGLLSLDKAAKKTKNSDRKTRLIAGRHDFLRRYRQEKWSDRTFYKKLTKLRHDVFRKTDPTRVGPSERLSRLRNAIQARGEKLQFWIKEANGCLQQPKHQRRAEQLRKQIEEDLLELDSVYAEGKARDLPSAKADES